MNLLTGDKINQGHPTTVFGEISVRSPVEWLKFSGAQEQLKISKMFRGDCSLGAEFRDLCSLRGRRFKREGKGSFKRLPRRLGFVWFVQSNRRYTFRKT